SQFPSASDAVFQYTRVSAFTAFVALAMLTAGGEDHEADPAGRAASCHELKRGSTVVPRTATVPRTGSPNFGEAITAAGGVASTSNVKWAGEGSPLRAQSREVTSNV